MNRPSLFFTVVVEIGVEVVAGLGVPEVNGSSVSVISVKVVVVVVVVGVVLSVCSGRATMKTTVGTAMTTMAKKTKAAMITGLLVILKRNNKKTLPHVSSCGIL